MPDWRWSTIICRSAGGTRARSLGQGRIGHRRYRRGGNVASPDDAASSEAVVTRHVDGDTFDVEYEGRDERVRLLNIDTPETKLPDRSAECLGSEAAKFLAAAAPVGSRLRLEFDKTQRDRYGRLLAAAFTSDGTLVNAEVARQGSYC